MRHITRSAVGLVILAVATPAWAEAPSTGFVTLDRMDEHSRFGAQLGLHTYDGAGLDDGFGLRTEVYGQLVFPTRVGIYGQLARTQLVVWDAEDIDGLSNLEVGGFYLLPGSTLVLRGGVCLPTGSNSGYLSNAATLTERLTDFVTVLPEATSLRFSASALGKLGPLLFFRGDLGFEYTSSDLFDELLMHANTGVGANLGLATLLGEVVTVGNLTGDGEFTDRFLHTISGSVVFSTLYASLTTPLDTEALGDVLVVSVGMRILGD